MSTRRSKRWFLLKRQLVFVLAMIPGIAVSRELLSSTSHEIPERGRASEGTRGDDRTVCHADVAGLPTDILMIGAGWPE